MKYLYILLISTSLFASTKYVGEDKCQEIIVKQGKFDSKQFYHRACVAEFITNKTNTSLPMNIDNNTILSKIYSEGDEITYKYILNKKISIEKQEKLYNQLLSTNCSNKIVNKNLFNMGLKLVYEYFGKDNNFLFDIYLDKRSCAK